MINVESSSQIARPRDEVFNFAANVDNLPKWQSGVISISRISEGPVTVGFRFGEKLKVGPWKVEAVTTVTDLKPNERIAFDVVSTRGPLDCHARLDFHPVAGGCRVTYHGEARLKGIWRLMQPLMGGEFQRETQAELTKLKQVLEASPGLESGPAAATI